MPHSSGTPERVLRASETLVVDLFPRGGLFADCTRTFCVGDPPEAVATAHRAVREALQLAHAAARPGARGWDLQVAVCEAFTARGYPTPLSEPGTLQGYVHGLGHGVGFELHEFPSFKRHTEGEGILAVGDVGHLPPGLQTGDFGNRDKWDLEAAKVSEAAEAAAAATAATGAARPIVLMILNDPPYGTERTYNGLRLAINLLAKSTEEDPTSVDVFLN